MTNAVAIQSIQHLPSLIDRASQALSGARDAAEILEAKEMAGFVYDAAKRAARLAKAKGAHDDVTAAALRVQADANEIIAGAQRRLADEYDAAQERGEVAKVGQPSILSDGKDKPTTAAEIGLSYKDIHEARIARDAERIEPGITRRVLDEQIASGKEPTKAGLNKALADTVRAARAAEQADNDKRRDEIRASLPAFVAEGSEAKKAAIATRQASAVLEEFSGADRIAELEASVNALEGEIEELRAENKLYGEMKAEWQAGGFEAVIAGKDEALRVAAERTLTEHRNAVDWKKSAKWWKDECIRLGWKPDRVTIDNETGEVRDA